MESLEVKGVKNILKKCKCGFTYIISLFVLLFGLWSISVLVYVWAEGNSIIVYISNILVVLGVLIEEKLENALLEKWYHKSKDGGFVKRRLKKILAQSIYKPSLMVGLYMYYLLCIAAERFFYFGIADNMMEAELVAVYIDLLSMMYYSFIFLMAVDKVRGTIHKEYKARKKYYAKYEE